MSELAGVRSPHLSILPRVLPLDGLLPRLHLGRLLHHHHLPPQHLRQHLLLLLPRLLLPHQEQLAQSSVLHGDYNNNEYPHSTSPHCPLIAVRSQHRQRSLRGACQRDHHLRVQALPQPGAAGGHLPQHGEVRD